MKIHILPVGFTSKVFTDSGGAIVREGADRMIALHMPYRTEAAKEKVETTIKEVEKYFGMKIERRIFDTENFSDLVVMLRKFLDGFPTEDRLFLHLGGGERHLGLALIYASFFTKNKATLIATMEYGFEKGQKFRYEHLPQLVPQKPTNAQEKILKTLPESTELRLSEIIKRAGMKFDSSAPSVMRHLQNLIALNLAEFDPKTKTYRATKTAKMLLAM